MIAVITADLINSSGYSQELLSRAIAVLNEEFKKIQEKHGQGTSFRIYRGDSFQGIIKNPGKALHIAITLKAAINKISTGKNPGKALSIEADSKTAIGIGAYDFVRDEIAESNGQAFQFSGRTLDEMKKSGRTLMLKTPDENINGEFNSSLLLLDTFINKWSTASAEVIFYLLHGYKEQEIADKLNISQSAVNQRKKAAGWEAISSLLERYEKVISEKFSL
ncbi:SatD family protein [Zunongwangia sp. H14]|uniref:SatD family protein n=1 Tax=Zunongwangia sp. H14 TaxID=3240792 RepID=UPI003562D514